MTQIPADFRLQTKNRGLQQLGVAGLLVAAFLLATLPLWLVGLLVGGAATGLLLIRQPWLAWCGLAVALPVTSALRLGPLSLTDLVLAGAIFLWFADGVRRRSLRLDPSALPGFVGIYLAVLLLSSQNASDLGEAAAEVIKWGEVLIAIWLVGQTLTASQRRWLVVALLMGGALQGILGVYQFVFRIGPDAFVLLDRFMRAAGSFGQPNPYAGYLGLTLPVSVSLTLWAWQRFLGLSVSFSQRQRALRWLLFSALATGVMGLGLLASWSRGGWLGALAGVGFVLVFRSRRALFLSLTAAALLLVVLIVGGLNPEFVPPSIAARLADIPAYVGVGVAEIVDQPVTDENFSVIERLAHWIAALRMWERAPWLGVGPGNYAAVYPEVNLPLWTDPLGHAHNYYLNALAETGVIGLAAYLSTWTLILVFLWRRLRQTAVGTWFQALLVGVVGVILHLSVHNLFDNLYVQGMYLHVALWLGVASKETNKNWSQE